MKKNIDPKYLKTFKDIKCLCRLNIFWLCVFLFFFPCMFYYQNISNPPHLLFASGAKLISLIPACLLALNPSPPTAKASPTRGVAALTAARVSQQAAAAASAALSARRAGYPLAVAAALANSHQRNLVLAGNAAAAAAAVSSAAIQGSPVVSVAGPVSLTSSMNAALAAQQQHQHQQQQQAAAAAAVAASPTLHGLSP